MDIGVSTTRQVSSALGEFIDLGDYSGLTASDTYQGVKNPETAGWRKYLSGYAGSDPALDVREFPNRHVDLKFK